MNRKRNRLALPAGYRLGRYRLGDQLGAGTFGITYLADDLELDRQVAIKELLPRDIVARSEDGEVVAIHEADDEQWEWAKERFMQEASTIAACSHPHILEVYQTFRATGTVYMVTRYEDGCVLKQWLDELGRAPSETELRRILIPMLSALECVHSQGFLHRDIQPHNIYLTSENGPLLIDFGSARQVVSRRSQPVTSIVCEGYAPFEQYADTGQQGAWTDLYGLGAVLYRCVTGQKPPNAPDRSLNQGSDPCICLASTYSGQYSKEFLRFIDKAMAVDISRRFRTATEWRVALGSPSPPPETADRPPPLPKPVSERRAGSNSDRRSPSVATVPTRGSDVQQDLHITAQEAVAGVEKVVGFDRQVACSVCGGNGEARLRSGSNPCPTCFGRGHVVKRTQVRVSLSPKTPHGATMRSQGHGHTGSQGGPSGDLHIRVHVGGADPLPSNPPNGTRPPEGNRGAAFTSILLPGIGSVPSTAVLPSMVCLLSTIGLYFIAYQRWTAQDSSALPVTIAAALLHVGAIVAGWRAPTEPMETRFLPRAFGGWLMMLLLLSLLCWEAFVLLTDSPGWGFGAAGRTGPLITVTTVRDA